MKVAILACGGDCPGPNAVIRAVVRRGERHGFELVGVRDGLARPPGDEGAAPRGPGLFGIAEVFFG